MYKSLLYYCVSIGNHMYPLSVDHGMHYHSGCMGDTQFHYRIRCSGAGAGGTDLRHTQEHHGAPLVLMVSVSRVCVYAHSDTHTHTHTHLQPDPGYYYGFVYFRQVKDSDIKRGYYQKVCNGCVWLGAFLPNIVWGRGIITC